MNTNIWLWVAGIVVVGGIGVYAVTQGGFSLPASAPADGGAQTTGSQSNSLSGLLALGISQKCSFSSDTTTSASAGVVYIANGMMRGDFTSTSNGQTVVSHMIVKDNTSHVWSSQMSQGIKMAFGASGSGASSQSNVDVNAQVNYSCSPWTVDQAQFELPAGITFMSVGDAGLPAGGAGAGVGVSAQCSACDQAPTAEQRTQCRAALQCP